MHARVWKAILPADLATGAREALDAITADLERLTPQTLGAASTRLAYGSEGDLALYFAYLADADGARCHAERADMWLDAAIADAGSLSLGPGLFGGIASLAWIAQHLASMPDGADSADDASSSGDAEDSNVPIDDILLDVVRQEPWPRDYDLIGGLVGIGVYFLERLPGSAARAGLEQIVRQLEAIAEPGDPGVRWFTPARRLPDWQRQLAPDGYYNLGLAHGIPGIIALLGHCVSQGIATPRAERLLTAAMEWLLTRDHPGHGRSRFENWELPGTRSTASRGSRQAWCYGDPGIAVAILSAGWALSQAEWVRIAMSVLHDSVRQASVDAGVVDAALCHGAAGLAHIYNRVFQLTGDELVGHAAREWLLRTIRMRTTAGYGGYQAYRPTGFEGESDETPWRNDASLLTGSAGIGLTLLAAVTDRPPAWDRRLLISWPGKPARQNDERAAELPAQDR